MSGTWHDKPGERKRKRGKKRNRRSKDAAIIMPILQKAKEEDQERREWKKSTQS